MTVPSSSCLSNQDDRIGSFCHWINRRGFLESTNSWVTLKPLWWENVWLEFSKQFSGSLPPNQNRKARLKQIWMQFWCPALTAEKRRRTFCSNAAHPIWILSRAFKRKKARLATFGQGRPWHCSSVGRACEWSQSGATLLDRRWFESWERRVISSLSYYAAAKGKRRKILATLLKQIYEHCLGINRIKNFWAMSIFCRLISVS